MSENIFRSELIQKYRKSNTVGTGEIINRNGVFAINLKPAPFYQNLDGGTVSAILRDEVKSNTQYIFDLWIDADDSYSNETYRTAGLVIYYTDGTSSTDLRFVGNGSGFVHKQLITPEGKSIQRINVYYGYNLPVYYRLDSYIAPVSIENINKYGQLNTTYTIENDQGFASFLKGGSTYCNNIYEY